MYEYAMPDGTKAHVEVILGPAPAKEILTWGGGDVPHGEPVPSPDPFHGLNPADVVHTGEVTVDFDGTPAAFKTFTTSKR